MSVAPSSPRADSRHCERSEAIQGSLDEDCLDCFAALLLATTEKMPPPGFEFQMARLSPRRLPRWRQRFEPGCTVSAKTARLGAGLPIERKRFPTSPRS